MNCRLCNQSYVPFYSPAEELCMRCDIYIGYLSEVGVYVSFRDNSIQVNRSNKTIYSAYDPEKLYPMNCSESFFQDSKAGLMRIWNSRNI